MCNNYWMEKVEKYYCGVMGIKREYSAAAHLWSFNNEN